MNKTLFVVVLVMAAVAGIAGTRPQEAQAPPPPTQQSEVRHRIVVESELVLVPVTVKDPAGGLVGDLSREEFRLFEDGIEQNIVTFSTEAFPLSAVVVLDNDLSRKAAGQVQRSLKSIAAGFSASDEVALIVYDDFPHTALDFTRDNDKLFTTLSSLELGSHYPGFGSPVMSNPPTINGRTDAAAMSTANTSKAAQVTKDMDYAVYEAARMLRDRGRDRRKIICLVSDGTQTHSSQVRFNQVREMLLSSDISIYSIFAGNSFFQRESSRLEKYASQTGGDAYAASRQSDLEKLYSRLTEEARHQYTLAYAPQRHGSGGYHTIEARVERPGLRVTTREGYFDRAPR